MAFEGLRLWVMANQGAQLGGDGNWAPSSIGAGDRKKDFIPSPIGLGESTLRLEIKGTDCSNYFLDTPPALRDLSVARWSLLGVGGALFLAGGAMVGTGIPYHNDPLRDSGIGIGAVGGAVLFISVGMTAALFVAERQRLIDSSICWDN